MSIKTKIAEELASRVKGGDSLAMDFASRMQRAKEQGFDTDTVYYHGTNADFDEFKGGGSSADADFFTKNPELASEFAEQASFLSELDTEAPKVLPVRVKAKNTFDSSNPKHVEDVINNVEVDDLGKFKWYSDTTRKNPVSHQFEEGFGNFNKKTLADGIREDNYSFLESPTITDAMKKSGYDSFYVREGEAGFDGFADDKNIAVFDPSNIRSVNAAFDPAKKDSSNLLAEMGAGIGAATTLPWMAKRAEAAEQERISAQIDESIGNMSRGQTIEAPINPYYQTASDAVGKYNRAIKGSPAEYLLGAEGLEDYLRHGAYGEADMFDRGTAALNIAELFAAPAEGLKYLGKITD